MKKNLLLSVHLLESRNNASIDGASPDRSPVNLHEGGFLAEGGGVSSFPRPADILVSAAGNKQY